MAHLADRVRLSLPAEPSPIEREAADPATAAARLEELARERCVQHLVAANPSTPVTALRWLRRSTRQGIRAAVARNSNISSDLAMELVADYPTEIIENAAFPFLLLEMPELAGKIAQELSRGDLLGLLRCEQLPMAILKPLARSPHEAVRDLAARHVALAGQPDAEHAQLARAAFHDALSRLPVGAAEIIVALRGVLPPTFLALLLDTPSAGLIAQSPDAPGDLLSRLPLTDAQIAPYVASHRHALPATLSRLGDHPDAGVRARVAGNPRTPGAVLRRLSHDPSVDVRLRVGANPQSDPETLQRLARDPSPRVRVVVARNPNVPPHALRALATDPEAQVRTAEARDHTISPSLLAFYAQTSDPVVRRAVAGHPDTPPAVLERLALDRESTVRAVVARHPRLSREALERLTRDAEAVVRGAAARHPRLPIDLRYRLERDADLEVRQCLAYNPHTPFMTLSRLWTHATAEQRRVIARHPAVTPARRARLYARLLTPHLRHMREAPSMARLVALASRVLPDAAYGAGSQSHHWVDRYVVASNTAAPLAIVEVLAHDGITYVRVAAQANLTARLAARQATDGGTDPVRMTKDAS